MFIEYGLWGGFLLVPVGTPAAVVGFFQPCFSQDFFFFFGRFKLSQFVFNGMEETYIGTIVVLSMYGTFFLFVERNAFLENAAATKICNISRCVIETFASNLTIRALQDIFVFYL